MKCQACGFANPDGFRFCGSCGIALLHETSAEMDAHAERRNITVVFCDLVGSTQLSEQLDDEAFRTVVRAYQSVATAAVEKFGGHVAQHLGDGLMAYFGYPVAHEEDPRRATLAALEICASLPAANEQIRRDHGVELAVRIGIHTGPAIAGDVGGGRFREQLALGRTPNVAARVQAAADPGTVLVSEDTWRLIHGFFDATDLGPTTLKGLATPMALYRIIAPTGARTAFDAARARGLAPIVGRAQEVQHLLDAFRAAAAGTGTTIGLRGEPGIGKSRLADAFRSAAEHAGAVSWLSGQCSPYDQSTAYGPLAAVVADALGIADRDTGEARGTKVRDGLAALQVERPDAVPLLCELLGAPAPDGLALAPMTPVLRKERTLGAMAELVARTASRGPTVVCVEDLHWADPSTLEFLALLAARTSALPMVLLLTARPEFEAPWLPATTVLSLERLPAEASRALAASVAQRQLPDRLSALIHARTDGIPLFVEELTKVIVESGVLDGERAADTAEWEAVIPGSLRDSIAARLDSLGPARRIAQLASVIGRDFGRDLLGIVADDDAHVEAALERLLDAGLAYREGNVEPARYSFKHALVRDAAYESLLRSTRLELHGRVATAIRERFPELRESRPDLVAYHLTEAGARADAIPLWLQAGKGAMDRSANLEAAAFLSRGIAALEDVPESPTRVMQELELQMTLASASMLAGGYGQPQVEQAYARAHALSDALGSPPQLYIVYFGLWMYYVVTADFRRAMVVCDDLTRMAEAIDTAGYRVEALFCTAYTEYYMGRLLESERHFRAAIALESAVTDEAEFRLSPAGDDVRIHSRVFLGMLLWHLGRSDEAVATAEAGVRIAREIGYPYGIVWGLDSLAWLHVFRNDPGAAAATAMEMVGICQERGFPFFTALGGLILGWSAIQGGDMQTGVPMFEQSLAGLLMAGARQSHTLFRSQLAATYLAQERLDDATAEVDRAFALMDAHDEHAWEPEVHLVHGALLLAQAKRGDGSLDAAAAAYLRARDVARAQGALGYRVRAGLMAAQALPPGSSRDSALEELRSIIPLAEEHGSWPDLERAKVLSAG